MGLGAFGSSSAVAAVSCSFNSNAAKVSVSLSGGSTGTISRDLSGAIKLNGTLCSTATTSNTDTIEVTGSAGSEHLVIDMENGAFAPGKTAEAAGISEIELTGSLGSVPGTDELTVRGGEDFDNWLLGADGMKLNSDGDRDLTIIPGALIELQGVGGPDRIRASGGGSIGAVFSGPASLTIAGGGSSDQLTGGAGADKVFGGYGDDTISGGAGDDSVSGGPGKDDVSGGAGYDTLRGGGDFLDSLDGEAGGGMLFEIVSVDIVLSDAFLSLGNASSTLANLDAAELMVDGASGVILDASAFTGRVSLSGGPGDDVLLAGTGTANRLFGEDGDDTLTGSPGDDLLVGGLGSDVIRGEGGDDDAYGRAGNDDIRTLGGDDLVDGGPGTDFCRSGGGTDTVSACESANTLPDAVADSGTGFGTDEDTSFTSADVLSNDTDSDGDTLTVTSIDDALTEGTVTDNADGTFEYDPSGAFDSLGASGSDTDTFTYTVSDGFGGTDTATVTIDISGLNDAPDAVDDSGTGFGTDEATSFTTGSVLSNDTDAENATLSVSSVDDSGTLGTVTDNADGTFEYDPAGAFDSLDNGDNDTDSFTYTVSDGAGGTDTATVTIAISGVNHEPVAADDSSTGFGTDEDTSFTTGDVLANDTDSDSGDTLSVSALDDSATSGTVTDNGDGTFDYDPAGAFETLDGGASTTDTFSYTVSDGHGGTDTATVTIGITGVNGTPGDITLSDTSVDENQSTGTAVGTLGSSDEETAQSSTFSLVTSGCAATFPDSSAFSASGTDLLTGSALNYESKSSYSICVRVTDNGTPAKSSDKAFTISVGDLNDAPSDISLSASTVAENEPSATVVGTLSATDEDSGQTHTFAFATGTGDADNASFTIDSGVLKTAASFDYETKSSYSVRVSATDTPGASLEEALVISVTNVNEAPANNVPGAQAVNEDTNLTFTGPTAISITDPDAGSSAVKLSLDVSHGTLTLSGTSGLTFVDSTSNGTGSVHVTGTLANLNSALSGMTYKGTSNFNSTRGTETLSVVTDDQGNTGSGGAQSDTDNIAITVNAVNDAPVAADKGFSVGTNLTIGLTNLLSGASDPDTGDAGYTASFTVAGVSGGTCSGCTVSNLNGSAGSVDVDPPAGASSGSQTLTYTITDSGTPGGGATSAAATITLNFSGPTVWFVDNTNGSDTNKGTLGSPFKTLGKAATVDASGQGIFLYSGTYADGITLDSSERLIGQGTTGTTFDSVFGLTPPSGTKSRPSLSSGTATVQGTVTLASSDTLRGLALSTGSSNALVGSGGLTGIDVSQTSVTTSSGTGLSLNNVGGSLSFTDISKNGSGTAISLTDVGASTTVAAGTIQNTTTGAIFIDGGSGNFSYAGSLSNIGSGRAITVQDKAASAAVTFSGPIGTVGSPLGGTGILLDNNDQGGSGGGVTFSGGVNLSTGVNSAFTATNGGAVSVTGASNTLATTSGTALNVAQTNIGSSGLTFLSISAGSGSGTAGNGIVLDTTGSAGGLTVSGSGTAGSGGTIQHKTGTSGQVAGNGVYLKDTKNVSLSRMQLNDFDNFAIQADHVNGLTLNSVVVSGANGNDSGFDEGSVLIKDSSGTITISGSNISGGLDDDLRVLYDDPSPLTATYNVTGTTFRDLVGGVNNSTVNLKTTTATSPSSNVVLNFTSSNVFENDANNQPAGATKFWADGILVNFEGPGQHTLNIRNNSFHDLFQALDMASNFSADVNFIVKDNTFASTESSTLAMGTGTSTTAAALVTALIQSNTWGNNNVNSGSRLGYGLIIDARGLETGQYTVHGNIFQHTELNGIRVLAQLGDGDNSVQLTNNMIGKPDDTGGGGFGVVNGMDVSANNANDVCLDARNNSSLGSGGGFGLELRQNTASDDFRLEGFGGNGTVAATVEVFETTQNPGITAHVRTGSSVVNYTSGTCTTPAII